MDAALAEQKNAVRAGVRRRLRTLDAAQRDARSREIVRRIVNLPAWREAARVLLFAPLPTEPDLDLLWREGALVGKQAAYPRVEGVAVRLHHVDHPGELESTRWGLREPLRAAREVALDDCGLVLVPGLAFDAAGGRLGRGGGFYDRLLSTRDPTRTRLLGVGFAFQLLEGPLPLAAHDVRLDAICTDGDDDSPHPHV